jgi:hypothetical protein
MWYMEFDAHVHRGSLVDEVFLGYVRLLDAVKEFKEY